MPAMRSIPSVVKMVGRRRTLGLILIAFVGTVLTGLTVFFERARFEAAVVRAVANATEGDFLFDTYTPYQYPQLQAEAVGDLGVRGVRILARAAAAQDEGRSIVARLVRLPLVGKWVSGFFDAVGLKNHPAGIRSIVPTDAILILHALGPRARPAEGALIDLTTNRHKNMIRVAAVFALGSLGELKPPTERLLLSIKQSNEPMLGAIALLSLWRLDPGNTELEQELIEVIGSGDGVLPKVLPYVGPAAPALSGVVRRAVESMPWGMARIQWLKTLWLVDGDAGYQLAQIEEITDQRATMEGFEGRQSLRSAVATYDLESKSEELQRALDHMRDAWSIRRSRE